jgi:hypothetical protein
VKLKNIPFETVDWTALAGVEHPGEAGVAVWRTQQFGEIRVRMVEYSAGYRADHWCEKGHLLLCYRGELHTELGDGRVVILRAGMGYYVADGAQPHRSFAPLGATLYVVD